MPLIIEKPIKTYDLSQIHVGDLIHAKYRTWVEGVSGFVSAVNKDQILVQYHPKIGNIVNHFFIPVKEAADGEWEIRWSEDLTVIHEWKERVEETDTESEDYRLTEERSDEA